MFPKKKHQYGGRRRLILPLMACAIFMVFLWNSLGRSIDSNITSLLVGHEDDEKEIVTTATTSNAVRFDDLCKQYPFPIIPKDQKILFDKLYNEIPGAFGFHGSGRVQLDNLIREYAKEKEVVVIMEVGVWLGQSVARWLNVSPKVRVVATDPFRVPNPRYPKLEGISEEDKSHFGKPEFNGALASYYIERNAGLGANSRTILFTGFHPQGSKPLFEAHRLGTGPDIDIFYLDGGKVNDVDTHLQFVRETLEGIIKVFPNVLITGDDWDHGNHADAFQTTVKDIARTRGCSIQYSDKTWIMTPNDQLDRFQGFITTSM